MEAIENEAIKNDTPAAHFFIPEDVAREFGVGFLAEASCRRWILMKIYREKEITCPKCYIPLTGIALQRFWEGKRICCRACGKFFTALTGTFLAGCHFNFQEIILLAVFLHFRIPKHELVRRLGISGETVRLWEIKFNALKRMNGMTESGAIQVRVCRVCGCTDDRACEGGCYWVHDPAGGNLCSRCEERLRKTLDAADDLVEGAHA